jgi:2-keto-4-pentenoate hydratase
MSLWHHDERARRGMERQLEQRAALLDDGARAIGWKSGMSTPAAMESVGGIESALVGFLTDRTQLDSGAEIDIAGWAGPAIEPEIAVRLGTDLEAGADRAGVIAAIDALAPAIEVVDVAARPGPDDLEAVLAGDVFHRHVILGPPDATRAGLRLDGVRVDVEGNETYATDADPEAVLGSLVEVVRQVADGLGAFGERLRAGDYVITGSVIAQVPVAAGERIRCAFSGLGEVSVALR